MSTYAPSVEQITDGNGKPIVGARKHFFEIGTTTFKTIYSDPALTTPLTNPVKSDADGRYPTIYLDGLYKVVQEDASGTDVFLLDGTTLWTEEQVGEPPSTTQFALWDTTATYNIPDIVLGSDDNYYRSLADTNTGNNPTTTATSWELLIFGREWNTNVTYAVGDVVYGTDGLLYTSRTAANLGNNPITDLVNWNGKIRHDTVANAANTLKITDSATTNGVVLETEGSDTNIDLNIELKGTGAIKANTANDDLNFKRNGTGNVTINGGPIYGLVILDTPVILSTVTTNRVWNTVDMSIAYSAAAAAGASKAIIRFSSETAATTGSNWASFHIRKTGSGVTSTAISLVGWSTNSDAGNSVTASISGECIVNLDSNSDFDFYIADGAFAGFTNNYVVLVGYYI